MRKKAKRRTRWNSTFAQPSDATLKRKRVIAKRNALSRSLRQNKQGRKPIAKSNPERQAKRRKSYATKLAAYKRSETYKLVEARAEGRCEWTSTGRDVGGGVIVRSHGLRCTRTRTAGDRMTHHHKTYARFGGKELPGDIELLCDPHNEHAESQHPTRNRNYRKTAA